jgi:RNA polymerase sigma factor (sigma-70 family)
LEWQDRDVAAPWDSVWRLYFEHAEVFRAAISDVRARGVRIDDATATDLIHEFLLERAPAALETFRPERGTLSTWLFVVFRRYVLGSLNADAHRQRLLRTYEREHDGEADVRRHDEDRDHLAARAALSALPSEERRALRVFFGDAGSVRDVARALGISRWRADKLVAQAIDRIAAALQPGATTSQGDPLTSRVRAAVRRALTRDPS